MQDTLDKPDRILDIKEVCRSKVSLGKSCVYDKVRKGEFPSPILLSKGRVGWRESEVDAWINSRPIVDLRKPAERAAQDAATEAW